MYLSIIPPEVAEAEAHRFCAMSGCNG
ncbi:hypothetical protein EYZ11_012037 [Aspergillus tanneri]|uniref:Uncharacterized protein n=1 Tax=Aspergillus tanneri TaxID=1220188 RepID=A0A4S3J194_9EURO|nr:hypothetical protein EYZ11_012037 [Aspergillus tanneri]